MLQTLLAIVALTASTAVARVMNLEPGDIDLAVRRSEIALLEFHAPWCIQCQEFVPVWVQLAERLHGICTVAAINGDKYPEAVQRFNVEAFPTIIVFVDGKVHEEYKSGLTVEALLSYIENLHGAPLPPPSEIPEESSTYLETVLSGIPDGRIFRLSPPIYQALYLRNVTLVWLLLSPPLDDPRHAPWLAAYAALARDVGGRAAWGYVDTATEGVLRLTGHAHRTPPPPLLAATQAARHWAHPRGLESPAAMAAEAAEFVAGVLAGTRPPTVVGEVPPTSDVPRNDAVYEAVAETFERIVLAPVDSSIAERLKEEERRLAKETTTVLVMFFSRDCPVSVSALEWFHLVAAQWKEVAPSLRVVRFEAVENDYDYETFQLKQYPTFFILRREMIARNSTNDNEEGEGEEPESYVPSIREVVDRVHYDEVVELLKTEGIIPVSFEPRDEPEENNSA